MTAERESLFPAPDPGYETRLTYGSSNKTIVVGEGAERDEEAVCYMVGPVASPLGFCEGCGCRLQHPGPCDGLKGSIWLTPWMKWRDTNRCTVCAAYEEDADAQAELRHWLLLNAPYEPGDKGGN